MKHRSLRHLEETVAKKIADERFKALWEAAALNPRFQTIGALLAGMPPSSITHNADGTITIDFTTQH